MATNTTARLGTANAYDTARNSLMERQSNLVKLQENLTSGKRVNVASDDPTAAAQAERALNRISRIQTDQRALEAQRSSIVQAESTLGDIGDALQNFRELVVSAGAGAHSAGERKIIANQLTGLRDEILALANRNDANGQPLFAALGSALKPFVGPQAGAPDYTFNGLPGQSSAGEVSIPYTLDGDAAFMYQNARDGVYNVQISTIPTTRTLSTNGVTVSNPALVNGASYSIAITAVDTTTTPGTTVVSYSVTETPPGTVTPQVAPGYPTGQNANIAVTGMAGLALTITGAPAVGDTLAISSQPSVFSVMDDAIRDIGDALNNNASTQAVGQALFNLDIGINRVSTVRGQAGELLNRADNISGNQEQRSIQMETDRSRAEDLDMVKGLSDFQTQQTGYQAALQSYAQVQKLSLFNFIS
jgi:flagellar hook-associated protein 3 FlgL